MWMCRERRGRESGIRETCGPHTKMIGLRLADRLWVVSFYLLGIYTATPFCVDRSLLHVFLNTSIRSSQQRRTFRA